MDHRSLGARPAGRRSADGQPSNRRSAGPDELPGGTLPTLEISTAIDGTTVQRDNTGDLLFDPVTLVEYVSTMITLRPGDVIATGTPGGVGHARTPARYLRPGQRLVTEISGLGRCENTIVAAAGA